MNAQRSTLNSQLPILRMLIRNDEALIEHLAEQLRGEDGVVDALPLPGQYSDERARTLRKLGDRIRILQRRADTLETLTPAATADDLTPLAGPLSQQSAALPGVIP